MCYSFTEGENVLKSMNRALVSITALTLIGVVTGCGDTQSGSASAPTVPKEVISITSVELFKAYDANEVATDERLNGKLVKVSGTVQAIDKDAFNNIVINLKTTNEFMPSRMQMNDSEKTAAVALKKGAKSAVVCEKMSRVMGSPSGRDCTFAKSS